MRVKDHVDVARIGWGDAGERRRETIPRPQAFRMLEGFCEVERMRLDLSGGEQKRVVYKKGDCFIVAVFVRGWLAEMEVLENHGHPGV
jgi:hypothetical protein